LKNGKKLNLEVENKTGYKKFYPIITGNVKRLMFCKGKQHNERASAGGE
jgi:hypothetical protein